MNRINTFLVLAAFMALCLSANAQITVIDSGYCGGVGDGKNLEWKLTSDSVLTISGSGDMADYVYDAYVPWYSYQFSIFTIMIGDSVTTIGNYAFSNCRRLTSVTIPNNVTTIGYYAFSNCYNLRSVTIGNSVITIGNWAFDSCNDLTSVSIGNSVTTIGDYAFQHCSSLNSIIIPHSVVTIGYSVFWNCSNLTSIDINSNNFKYSSIDGIVYKKMQDTLILCPQGKTGTVVIPNSVTAIGDEAFHACRNLISVTIGNNVICIGHEAFDYCTSLTSITMPNGITTIGNYAFRGCGRLTSITIPDSVTSIGCGTFQTCNNLNSIMIGNSVKTIGDMAFFSCNKLTSITSKAITPPMLGSDVFYKVPANIPVFVPCGTLADYQRDWTYFSNFIEDCESIDEIVPNEKISVYPNPTSGQLIISLPNPSEGGAYTAEDIEIYDVLGQKVLAPLSPPEGGKSPLSFGEGQGVRLDVSHLPAGVYFLRIGDKVMKFVKE